jgi:hypothetical protein
METAQPTLELSKAVRDAKPQQQDASSTEVHSRRQSLSSLNASTFTSYFDHHYFLSLEFFRVGEREEQIPISSYKNVKKKESKKSCTTVWMTMVLTTRYRICFAASSSTIQREIGCCVSFQKDGIQRHCVVSQSREHSFSGSTWSELVLLSSLARSLISSRCTFII